jgi:hypothetical protein
MKGYDEAPVSVFVSNCRLSNLESLGVIGRWLGEKGV